MSIEIPSDETNLTRKLWRFNTIDRHSHIELRLTWYAEQTRKSKRCKWRNAAVWPLARGLPAERDGAKALACPGTPPADVCERARAAVLASMTIVVEGA